MNLQFYFVRFSMILLIIGIQLKTYPIGESAVITLEFPPGAENSGLAESGVSLANSSTTMFWNPASLPAVHDHLETRLQLSYFNEDLLPSLTSNPTATHSFYSGALFFNDFIHTFDFAYGFYKNSISLGEEDEEVFANCIGVRAFDIISLGLGLKKFETTMGGTANEGFAFDVGARLEYKANITSTPIEVKPALGFSIVNLGRDSVEYNRKKSPLPRGFYMGASIATQCLELFSYTIAGEARGSLLKLHDNDSLWVYNEFSDYQYNGGRDMVVSVSNQFQIASLYSYGFGYMIDYNGRRFERHGAHSWTFDARKIGTLILRIIYRDLEPESQKIKEFHERVSLFGGKIKPNIRFTYSKSTINSIDGIREGQEGIDMSIGF